MFNKTDQNVWFFVGHSIGVTLLGLHTLETVKRSTQLKTNFFVVVNGTDKQPYEALLAGYPYITIVHLTPVNFLQLSKILVAAFFQVNYLFHPLSFGAMHKAHRFISWTLICWKSKSRTVEFVKESLPNSTKKWKKIPRDLSQSIFVSAEDAVRVAGFQVITESPKLQILRDKVLYSVGEPYIVIQPFAASPIRSLPLTRWRDIIMWLRQQYPHYVIIISGGFKDRDLSRILMVDDKVYFITDVTTNGLLGELQLIADARLFIGPDTGPTHIAAHLQVRTLLIGNLSNPCWLPTYSFTTTILTAPENCICTGAKVEECFVEFEGMLYYRCMFEVTQDQIFSNIKQILHE